MIGRRFGKLVVDRKSHSDNGVRWICVCDCGNEKTIRTGHLNAGKQQNVKTCPSPPSWAGSPYTLAVNPPATEKVRNHGRATYNPVPFNQIAGGRKHYRQGPQCNLWRPHIPTPSKDRATRFRMGRVRGLRLDRNPHCPAQASVGGGYERESHRPGTGRQPI